MTMLTIVQGACKELGIDVPTAVAASTDAQVIQLLALLNDCGQEMADMYDWPFLEYTKEITTVASELQGDLETLFGDDYEGINFETFWKDGTIYPVYGNLTPQQYQWLRVRMTSGVYSNFRLQLNPDTNKMSLYVIPAPSAGETWSLSVQGKSWATNASQSTRKTAFTADDDLSFFEDRLLRMGLVWRWRASKRLDYQLEAARWSDAVESSFVKMNSTAGLNVGQRSDGIGLINNLNIPDGNYN